jgi:hypothetical protein
VNVEELNKITKEKDKYLYISKCMNKAVKDMLYACFAKIRNREKREYIPEKIPENKEQFDWLKVDSK